MNTITDIKSALIKSDQTFLSINLHPAFYKETSKALK